MKKVIYLLLFIVCFVALKAQVQIKINNRTGYDVHAIQLPCEHIALLGIDAEIIINTCKEIIFMSSSYGPIGFGKGSIYNKQKSTLQPLPRPTDPSEFDTLRNGEIEYDLLLHEDEYGYRLFYKFKNIINKPAKKRITNNYVGEYIPVNEENDKLAAICKEGTLRINEDNTFQYILTPDKVWCPEMKDYVYEGDCIEENDTLYLHIKDGKQLIEPKFNFTETDLNNEITISFYNEAGELIDIEGAQSISSTKKDMDRNSFKVPFEKNYIKVNDKRLLGLTVKPVGYPEVQIVLKKIKAGAKINVTLFNTYYDTLFSNRKFVYSYNVLTEVTNNGTTPANYTKNKQ